MISIVPAIGKVLVPYMLVFAGFIAGRVLRVNKESLASLLVYIVSPVVLFAGVSKAELEFQYFFLPVLFFILCCSICGFAYVLARPLFKSPALNILAYTSGNCNSGYFAIPVGMALLGEGALSAIILCSFGFILFDSTIGFYISARGHHSHSESIKKVLKLPAVYAFALGLTANLGGMSLNGALLDFTINMRGAYSVLGMMMIGLALAELKKFNLDITFSSFACAMKFIVWPCTIGSLLFLESRFCPFISQPIRQVIFFMSTMPLAANTVAISTLLRTEPERAAVAVLLSTLMALPLVPILNSWFA